MISAQLSIGRVKSGVRYLLEADLSGLPWWKSTLFGAFRVLFAVGRDATEGDLNLRAMSLVYTTLLSMVPLLALSFSVLKGFGVHNQLEPLLLNFLEPLGTRGVEITNNIIQFVENIRVGVLGFLGLGLLIYTVISLVQKVESAFNYIWRVSQLRGLGERFSEYLSVILVGPLLVVSALGITASVMSSAFVQKMIAIEPFGTAIFLFSKMLPYVLVIGAFTFVYTFVPNTKVRFGAALGGGMVAGALWQTTGWAFALFVASSTNYAAIYSSFAILIMFLIWLYLSWLILLVGANISFYLQHSEYTVLRRGMLRLSNRVRERLAVLIMTLIGQRHYQGSAPWTLSQLARKLVVPEEAIARVTNALEREHFVARTSDDPPGYLPARALETITIKELLDAVRRAEEESHISAARLESEHSVNQLFEEIDQAVAHQLAELTLKELAVPSRKVSLVESNAVHGPSS